MNFQEKILEASAELRTRAAAFASATADVARDRARLISVLGEVRREFGKVARHHTRQFAKQNTRLASAARRDVSDLARSAYAIFTARPAAEAKSKRTRRTTSRQRSAKPA